jgi:hypothetical protein
MRLILVSNRRTITRGMKRCSRCRVLKPYSEFHRNRKRRDGLQNNCKSCRAVIDHGLYSRRRKGLMRPRTWECGRQDWLLSLKAGRSCTDCQRTYLPQVLQWDHLPGTTKLGNISTDFRGRSRQEILDEIAKCELVCANCHAIRTFARAGWASSWTESEVTLPVPSSTRRRVAMGEQGLKAALPCVVSNSDGASMDPDLKRCALCGLWKPHSEFHDSTTGQFSYCRMCRRAYDRNYYHHRGKVTRNRRHRARVMAERAWMASLKEGLACTDCGEKFAPYVMHWDHVPGHDKIAWHQRASGQSAAYTDSLRVREMRARVRELPRSTHS